jgi:Cyanobacterial TRADD-N associated 2-Transmembrane domain
MAAEEATPPESAAPDKVLELLVARRDQLQRAISKFRFRWSLLIIACAIGTAVDVGIDVASGMLSPATWYQSLPLGALVGGCFYLFLLGLIHADLRGDLMQTNRILAGIDINKLQATLDEDFFTKLVKINFKYIDQYYLQTQSQADKSFRLSAAVAIVGLLIVIAGIVLMFLGRTTPAYGT